MPDSDGAQHADTHDRATATSLDARLDARTRYQLSAAVSCLRAGGVIAHPTEGVWGLACVASSEGAIEQILTSKRRSWRKGLILVSNTPQQFAPLLAQLPDVIRDQVLGSWPGPKTWLVPHAHRVSPWISGDSSRVALRVTAHRQFAALCHGVGTALVSTSANRAGAQPLSSARAARRVFGGEIDFVLDGELGGATGPSAIVDALSGAQLRAG